MFFRSSLTALLAFSGLASAHFRVTYPPSRGFVSADEVISPCGNFNTTGARTPFPLGDAFVRLSSGHDSNYTVLISFAESPTNITNFTTSATGAPQAALREYQVFGAGDSCLSINIGSKNYPSVVNGTNATIGVRTAPGEHASLYQCSDVVLLSDATIPANWTCTANATASGTATAAGTSHTGSAGRSIASTAGLAAVLGVAVGVMISI